MTREGFGGSPTTPGQDGQQAEEAAARFLASRGLTLVARNFAAKSGEIDLVAREGEVLVFVEVRLRRHRSFGGGAASVDPRKQRRIANTAALYLQKHYNGRPPPCRFDVIAISRGENGEAGFSIDWLRDAFRPEG